MFTKRLRKYIATDTVASSGGKCFKKLQKGQINPKAGLYNDNDVRLASWDELIYAYGMRIYNGSSSDSPTDPNAACYIFTNNSELSGGTKLIIDSSIFIDYLLGGFGICKDCTTLKSVILPDGIKYITSYMFARCTSLTSIYIPDGVTTIQDGAFRGCTSLVSVTIPDGVSEINPGAFTNCTSLKHIAIPDSVKELCCAFSGCSSLEHITIPDGGIYIEMGTFSGCTSLASITIPSSITNIGGWAFDDCTSLTDVYYKGTEEQWNAIEIQNYGNECLTNATIHYNSQ